MYLSFNSISSDTAGRLSGLSSHSIIIYVQNSSREKLVATLLLCQEFVSRISKSGITPGCVTSRIVLKASATTVFNQPLEKYRQLI